MAKLKLLLPTEDTLKRVLLAAKVLYLALKIALLLLPYWQ